MKHSYVANSVLLALAASLVSNSVVAEVMDAEEIENIVVTGQKIDRTLQETPNSVAVVTSADIEKQNISNVSDVFSSMPNVHGNLNDGFSIRGIDSFNVSGGGNSYLTSMYFDGAPMPFRMMRMGTLSMWDVSQVEVFRGPQSTIQGRNSLAGAVVIRSEEPTYEYKGKVQAVFGENGQQEFAFAGGGALVEDQLAFRVSAETKDLDGYNYNVTRGEQSDYIESDTLRAKLLFEPKAIEDLTAILSYTKAESEIGPRWANTAVAGGTREVFFNAPILEYNETDITNLEISYLINDAWTFDSITTYNEVEYGYLWDGDATEADVSTLDYVRYDETFSQEFRLTFEYEKLKGVIGYYYSDLDVTDKAGGQRALSIASLGLPTLLVAPPEYGGLGLPQEVATQVLALYAPADPVRLGTASNLIQGVESTAVFADLTYSLTDNFDLIAGLRFDNEKQKNGSTSLYTIDNADMLPDPVAITQVDAGLGELVGGINIMLHGQAAAASGTADVTDKDFDAFLPKLGVSYKVSEDITLNALYQKGYRSGGVGTNIAQAYVYDYDQEYTDNYELSLRSVWLNGDLVVNANLFYLDWTDQQVTVQLSGNQYDTETENAGKSEVSGFETEIFFYPTDNLTIKGGFGYAKTEFTDFEYLVINETVSLNGRPFADSPEHTANIAVSYDFGNGFYINADANYAGDSNAYINPVVVIDGFDPSVEAEPKNDARTLVNVQLGYELENYKVFLTAKNLFDEQYIEQFMRDERNESGYPQMILGTPRQLSLTLQANF